MADHLVSVTVKQSVLHMNTIQMSRSPRNGVALELKHSSDLYENAARFHSVSVCPDISNDNALLAAKCLIKTNRKDEARTYLQKCIFDERKDRETISNINEAKRIATVNDIRL